MGNLIDIKGYEGLYKIDAYGNIISFVVNKKGKKIKPSLSKNGYTVVNLFKNGKSIKFYTHRLIAIHLMPNPFNYPVINHINANRSDNRIENLEWCTLSQNCLHTYRLNRMNVSNRRRGALSKQSRPVLMVSPDMSIKKEFGSIGEAARFLGLKRQSNISSVLSGRRNTCSGYGFKYLSK